MNDSIETSEREAREPDHIAGVSNMVGGDKATPDSAPTTPFHKFKQRAKEAGYNVEQISFGGLFVDDKTQDAWDGWKLCMDQREADDGAEADRLAAQSAPTDYPSCSGNPSSCPENEGHGCCNAVAQSAPTVLREDLTLAAVNCQHQIDADCIRLWRDEKKEGSALSQLVDRVVAAVAQSAPTERRQYYYKNNSCLANQSTDPNCICWHDEGTGPLQDALESVKNWRAKPRPSQPSMPAVAQSAPLAQQAMKPAKMWATSYMGVIQPTLYNTEREAQESVDRRKATYPHDTSSREVVALWVADRAAAQVEPKVDAVRMLTEEEQDAVFRDAPEEFDMVRSVIWAFCRANPGRVIPADGEVRNGS